MKNSLKLLVSLKKKGYQDAFLTDLFIKKGWSEKPVNKLILASELSIIKQKLESAKEKDLRNIEKDLENLKIKASKNI